MPRLTRVHQKVFASNASNNGVFGSLQAGNPQTSNDVATLQSLSAFENGWDDAIEQGDKLPPLEEFQGIQYGISYQQAYMLQEGIAEWNASTPYYKGGLVKTISGTSFKLYCSLADNNTGNIVTNTTYWKLVMDSDDLYVTQSVLSSTISSLLSSLYPVGSLYIGTQSSCPMESLMTGSTWVLVAENRALWTGDGTNGNTTIAAGLPNITGKRDVVINTRATTQSGALYSENQMAGSGYAEYTSGEQRFHASPLLFDASRSNSIYGNSTTVQPPAYRVNVWRRTN